LLDTDPVYFPYGREGQRRDDFGHESIMKSGNFYDKQPIYNPSSMHTSSTPPKYHTSRNNVNFFLHLQVKTDNRDYHNSVLDNYELEMQIREKHKEEWKANLMNQMAEKECNHCVSCLELKKEQRLKKRMEEERDEERVHRQLREINDQVAREKSGLSRRKDSPLSKRRESPVSTIISQKAADKMQVETSFIQPLSYKEEQIS